MKTLKLFLSFIIAIGLGINSFAQTHDHSKIKIDSVRTESFKVLGKCDMCRTRIENAAKAEGAESASWDSETQILTVSYNPSETNKDAISKKLASAGHDTEAHRTPDDVYAKLPACCHYERNK